MLSSFLESYGTEDLERVIFFSVVFQGRLSKDNRESVKLTSECLMGAWMADKYVTQMRSIFFSFLQDW